MAVAVGVGVTVYQASHATAGYSALCLTYASQWCVQTNGSNNATISTSSTSRFAMVRVTNSNGTPKIYRGWPVYYFQNLSGNCLHAFNRNEVNVASCTIGPVEQWAQTTSSPRHFLNVGSDEAGFEYFLGVPGNLVPGAVVEIFDSGGWFAWNH